MEIVKRLIQIQSEVGPIAKSRKASTGGGGSYAFRGIDDIYQALHSLMDKHEVINIIEVQNFERSERDRIDKQTGQVVGVMIHVILKVKYTLLQLMAQRLKLCLLAKALTLEIKPPTRL
jgi:ERF superfamily.